MYKLALVLILCLSSCKVQELKVDCTCKYGKSLELFEGRGYVKVIDGWTDQLDTELPARITTINKNLVKGLQHDCLYGLWQDWEGQSSIKHVYLSDSAIEGYWEGELPKIKPFINGH